ncbi:hypothetical protein D6V26_18050 [Vibrio cholerae]|nr:hypothetical protein [Vibrio cholerae]
MKADCLFQLGQLVYYLGQSDRSRLKAIPGKQRIEWICKLIFLIIIGIHLVPPIEIIIATC